MFLSQFKMTCLLIIPVPSIILSHKIIKGTQKFLKISSISTQSNSNTSNFSNTRCNNRNTNPNTKHIIDGHTSNRSLCSIWGCVMYELIFVVIDSFNDAWEGRRLCEFRQRLVFFEIEPGLFFNNTVHLAQVMSMVVGIRMGKWKHPKPQRLCPQTPHLP